MSHSSPAKILGCGNSGAGSDSVGSRFNHSQGFFEGCARFFEISVVEISEPVNLKLKCQHQT
jgi:hypothetical protein